MIVDIYSEAHSLKVFPHTSNYYMTSLFDDYWDRIWVVPFHGKFNKVYVLNIDWGTPSITFYKQFDFEGWDYFTNNDHGRYINSIKFSTSMRLYVAHV